ncbi:transposase (plasmid) [Microvirga ossetica]|uniref:Transposase n=1 Tax=Microvirga ossetica TaxID=1882682 RepID=A0A1B2EVH5_9HYPH|nr:IS5 family transposase [Microvirga ossetica]ANY83944.1 transposase [Microvirga ossetica]
MPFKANAARRHRIPKQRHRVTNWAEYDASLRQRGGLTVWFSPEAIAAWRAEPRTCYLLVDSTGLRLCGPGEWLIEKHCTRRRRSWRKLHIGVDAHTGQILASELTMSDIDDGSQVEPLLDQLPGPLASFIGDGAYDQAGISGTITKRHPEAEVIVPPRSTAVLSHMAESTPSQRDRHLQSIAENGRADWQKWSGYTRRALVEAAISGFKRVIGDALRSRTDRRRATEVAVAIAGLNRMLELGRPKPVRIA